MPELALGSHAGAVVSRAVERTAAHRSRLARGARGRSDPRDKGDAPSRRDMIFANVKDAQDPVPALKQQLARAILDRLEGSGQFNVASRLGVDQPRASNLVRGRLERFSLQQLVRFAARVDGQLTMTVAWTSRTIWLIPRAKPALDARERHGLRWKAAACCHVALDGPAGSVDRGG
jgi:predicted XRE-type DNA-binding protein